MQIFKNLVQKSFTQNRKINEKLNNQSDLHR